VTGVSLLNPSVPTELAEGKVPILDVRARDDPGRQFLLEVQQFVRPAFAKRALYYWSGAHAEQLLKGDHYEMLQPTYVICFLSEALFEDSAYHHCFRPYDAEHGVLLCKDLEIHVLELSKFDLPVEEITTPLERWCFFFKHGASLDPDALPATLDVPAIHKALEVLVRISQNELERQRYLEQQRIDRDAASLRADVRMAQEQLRAAQEGARVAQEGARVAQEEARVAQEEARVAQEEARVAQEEAEEKARVAQEVGIRVGRIQAFQQLLGLPETSRADLGQLSEEGLVQLEESLKRQLSARRPANGTPPPGPT
jgi:predicted transposase/invertase (TIGR01784 family)